MVWRLLHFAVGFMGLGAAVLSAMAGVPELAVPYQSYRLRLEPYFPAPNHPAGLLLSVRLNHGPVLHLLLDTGATDLTIDRKSAERSGIEASETLDMVCPGESAKEKLGTGQARTIEIGPVSFWNYRVSISARRLAEGLSGVIPMSLFRGFLASVDFPRRTLLLDPYPAAPFLADGFAQAAPGQDLLLLKATFNRRKSGYVLIDSGSSYTALSTSTANSFRSTYLSDVSVRAVDGSFDAPAILAGARFGIGGRELDLDQVVAIDLGYLSRMSGIEISGLIGYPDLRTRVLTVNYRDSLVKLADAR